MKIEYKENRKQMTINMLANIVSYSTGIIISFILTPFLINTIGKETYSFYPMANTIVSYMSVLNNAMSSMASRFVTISLVQNKREEAEKYYSSAFAANVLTSTLLMGPMLVIVFFLDKIMDVPINSEAAIKVLYALVFSAALVNTSTAVLGVATFAKNRIDLRSFRELITSILRLVLYYVFYRFMSPSIIYVGIVTLIIAVVNMFFQLEYTRKLLPEIRIKISNVKLRHTIEMFSSSIWNAINTFGNTLLAGMTMILANIFFGAAESGAYSIVQTVPQFICGIITMLIGVFYPVITYRYGEGDIQGLVNEVKTTQKIVGTFGCATIAVFSALATEFFGLWTPGEDAQYLSWLSLLTILPHCLISCLWALTNVNVVMNKVKVPALVTLGCGVLNIMFAYVACQIYEFPLYILPTISSLLQCVWIGVVIPLYVCYNLKVKWWTFYPISFKICAIAIGIFLGIIGIKKYFILDTWVKFIVFAGVVGVFSVALILFVVLGGKNIKIMLNKFLKVRRKER